MTDRKLRLVDAALAVLGPRETSCDLCPRACRVDRTRTDGGVCATGARARVSHALLHFGEEPVLSGSAGAAATPDDGNPRPRAGSGTIFFAGCNLKCLFCQNYQLSWDNRGREVGDEELAAMMLGLQAEGALNINLVSPSHVVLPVLRALRIAYAAGLTLPLVWNSNGYDSLPVVEALDGIVDVYLPDLKYVDPELSRRYSGAADYFRHASAALREMSVQRPVLELDQSETAVRGLIVRHLILPGHVADTLSALVWIRENLSPFIGLSLMSQYHPCHKAPEPLRRGITAAEYRSASAAALAMGLSHLYLQPEPFAPEEHLVPDFTRDKPFRWRRKD